MTQRENLAEMISGRTDEEIIAGLERRGVDGILAQIFERMQERFVAARAAGQAVVIQYDIGAPDGARTWQVKVADGACHITQGASGPAGVTIGIALPDFLRLLSGQIDGPTAFMTGKLTMSGNFMLAQTMQTWFERGA